MNKYPVSAPRDIKAEVIRTLKYSAVCMLVVTILTTIIFYNY